MVIGGTDNNDFDHNWLEGGPGADVDTSNHDSNAAVEAGCTDVDNRGFLTEFKRRKNNGNCTTTDFATPHQMPLWKYVWMRACQGAEGDTLVGIEGAKVLTAYVLYMVLLVRSEVTLTTRQRRTNDVLDQGRGRAN